MPKIITITGFKGGVGKTVTAVHLAGYFATNEKYKGKKVLLIDADDNRSAKSWVERGDFSFKCLTSRQFMYSEQDSDIVVIDTPARPIKNELVELTEGSQLVILPTKTDGLSLEPTIEAVNLIKHVANYRILICANPSYPSKAGELLKVELRKNDYNVFDTTIRSTQGFGMAAEQGLLIKDLKHRSRTASFDYNDLCAEISL